ncbi:MAG: ABC transporter permease [Chloroflexi bacterium]|nr:ABC transporter permease [Chloroflexota bacterium]
MGNLLRMAWRNIWRNWRRTLIAIIAIVLGLTLMLLMDGVIVGSITASFGNFIKLQGGNVQIHAPGYRERAERLPLYPLENANVIVQAAQAQPEVVAASRRINTSGMVSSREGTFPVAIVGIEPEQEAPVSLIAGKINQGRYLTSRDEDMILVGKALAQRLDITVGDRIELVGRATHEQTRRRTMTIIGIFNLGLGEIEKRVVYVSLAEAQALFDLRDQATEVVVMLKDVGQEEQTVAVLQAALPPYEVDSWKTVNPEMRQTEQRHKETLGMLGFVVLLIAGIGVLNLMLMAVFERTREIGLLAAMGLKRREIMTLFLLEGILIGVVGALMGCAIGGLIVGYLSQVGFEWGILSQATEVLALIGDRIFPQIGIDVVIQRGLTIVIIAALAALYPAWQASKREPAEALHYV